MRLSLAVFVLSLAFVAGVFFASFFSVSLVLVLFLCVVGVFFFAVFWKYQKMAVVGVFLVAAALGILHEERAEQKLSFPAEQIRAAAVSGVVDEIVKEGDERTQAVFQPDKLSGRVLLYASPFQDLSKGDLIQVTGDLELPPVFEGFDYRSFLLKEGIVYVAYRPDIEIISQGNSFLFQFRGKLKGIIEENLSSPQASILGAVLLGFKAELPEELKNQLNATGTRHITAISGMHVALVMMMFVAFFLQLGLWRKQALFLSLLAAMFFIVLSGMQVSALRAGIMGGSAAARSITGRKNASLRFLVFAAAVLLFANPLLAGHDAGFQLSFLAVLGILLFFPVFQYVLRKVPNTFALRDIAAMSIAAQLFTLPLIVFHFGTLSFVSLLANMLVVPLLPFILAFGMLFLGGTLLFPFLGALFSFPVALLLSYLTLVVQQLSQLSFAATQISSFPLGLLLPFYLAASFFAWRFQQDKRFQFREQSMLI